jgi:transcriptional regulator with XRE-family HTH domain
MGKKSVTVMPTTMEILETVGGQVKMARLRRKLPTKLVAERAGISRTTLVEVEKGSPSVSIGIYAAVLHSLNGMDKDLLHIAKDDDLGRKLQDLELTVKKRAPKR